MRVVFASDIHSNLENVRKLKKQILHNKIDLIVLGGDLTTEGLRKIAEDVVSELSFTRLLALPGNMDSKEIEAFLKEKGINLHKKKVKLNGYTFIGLGYGKPVNTYYRLNIGELEAKKYLDKLYSGQEEKVILVSHTPPFNSGLDLTNSGIKLGLRALRETIEQKKPLLCVSGHVHEARGIAEIGKTKCINTGALSQGNAVMVELNEVIKIEWLRV